jgi:hypothetical protein
MTRKSAVNLLLLAVSSLALTAGTAHTQEGDPTEVGQLSPLIPLPKDAIHMGLSDAGLEAQDLLRHASV